MNIENRYKEALEILADTEALLWATGKMQPELRARIDFALRVLNSDKTINDIKTEIYNEYFREV